MSIADAIRRARERLGLSQTELARRIGVSKTAVSKWEDGTAAPNRNRVAAVARALGVSPETLSAHATLTLTSVDTTSQGRSIPLMDWSLFVQYGGTPPEAILASVPRLLANLDAQSDALALRVEDDPMPGHLSKNDIVIIDRSLRPVTGDLVVATVGGEIVLRQFQDRGTDSKGAPCFDLLSTNPDLPTRTVNSANPGTVLGVVVEVRIRRR